MGRQVDYTTWGYAELVAALKSVNFVFMAGIVNELRGSTEKGSDSGVAFLTAAMHQNISNIPPEQIHGVFWDTFKDALSRLTTSVISNAETLQHAGEALLPVAEQAEEHCKAAGQYIDTPPRTAKEKEFAARILGQHLNAIYDPMPDSLGSLAGVQSPGNPNAPSGVSSLGGGGGGGLPHGEGPSDTVQAFAERAKEDAEQAAQRQQHGGPEGEGAAQAAKGMGDALGKAAGEAGKGAGEGGGKGGGADPSKLASDLADALKPKDGAPGAGLGPALEAGEDAGLPGSVDAEPVFAPPVGGGLGGLGGGGGAGESARPLAPATSLAGPTQQGQPVSRGESLAKPDAARAAAAPGMGGGMGAMPHQGQGAGGRERRVPDYLKSQALLSTDPADQAVDAVIGELSDEEVAQQDQQALEVAEAEGARA